MEGKGSKSKPLFPSIVRNLTRAIMIMDGRLKALAELVHQLRPTWDRAGILSALTNDPRPIESLAFIAIDCAIDKSVRTPALIRTRQTARMELVPPAPWDKHLCPTCNRVHDPDQTACKRATPDVAQRGAAQARAALKAVK